LTKHFSQLKYRHNIMTFGWQTDEKLHT